MHVVALSNEHLPRIEMNPDTVPNKVRRVRACFSSSVRSVRPEMRNTVQMFINVTTCTSLTCKMQWEQPLA